MFVEMIFNPQSEKRGPPDFPMRPPVARKTPSTVTVVPPAVKGTIELTANLLVDKEFVVTINAFDPLINKELVLILAVDAIPVTINELVLFTLEERVEIFALLESIVLAFK